MRVIWCWAVAPTMSEAAALRVAKVRPARVWQPTDLARSTLLLQGFVVHPWSQSGGRNFLLQEVPEVSSAGDPQVQPVEAGGPDLAPQESGEPQLEPATRAEPPVSQELLEATRAQAYAQGVADTRAGMQAGMEQELLNRQVQERSVLDALAAALEQLKRSPQQYFEPLKRLAVHLAEQLVLAELSLDGKAIERLVQRCVDELASHDESMILVELHPADMALLETLRAGLGLSGGPSIKLKADATLLPGSARASANDALVQTLIEHRLVELAAALGVDQVRWNSQSAFAPEGLAQRVAEGPAVEDALPRMAVPQEEALSFDAEPGEDAGDA